MSKDYDFKERIVLKAYKVELSNKTTIRIDVDEFEKVVQAIATGSSVMLRQGFIANPNHIVDVVPDRERITEIVESNRLNDFAIKHEGKKPMELLPLMDEFQVVREKIELRLSGGQKNKELKNGNN